MKEYKKFQSRVNARIENLSPAVLSEKGVRNILTNLKMALNSYSYEPRSADRKQEVFLELKNLRDKFQLPIYVGLWNPVYYFVRIIQGWLNNNILKELDDLIQFLQEETHIFETGTSAPSLGVFWQDDETRQNEWNYAKSKLIINGQMLPEGTKLARTDRENKGHITHSFIVLGGEIIALSSKYQSFATQGLQGRTKLGENEQGETCVIKATTVGSRSLWELRQEGKITKKIYPTTTTTERTKDKSETKYYIKMPYLGMAAIDYMVQHHQDVSMEERFDLTIKSLRAIKVFHHPDDDTYLTHQDIKTDNIVVDDNLDVHIIDMGLSKYYSELSSDVFRQQKHEVDCLMRDIIQMFFYSKNDDVAPAKTQMERIKNDYNCSNHSMSIEELKNDLCKTYSTNLLI